MAKCEEVDPHWGRGQPAANSVAAEASSRPIVSHSTASVRFSQLASVLQAASPAAQLRHFILQNYKCQ